MFNPALLKILPETLLNSGQAGKRSWISSGCGAWGLPAVAASGSFNPERLHFPAFNRPERHDLRLFRPQPGTPTEIASGLRSNGQLSAAADLAAGRPKLFFQLFGVF